MVEVAGHRLLDRALEAVAGAELISIVGPPRPGYAPELWAPERPLNGGPVAALAAGLQRGSSEIVAVLAVDMPLVTSADIAALIDALISEGNEGAALADQAGRTQYLAGAYVKEGLKRALLDTHATGGKRLHEAVARLSMSVLPSEAAQDCDRPEDIPPLESQLEEISARKPGAC